MDDDGAPEIWCLVCWPVRLGDDVLDFIPSKRTVVTLEDAEQYQKLGWVVMLDYETRQAYFDWQRWQHGTRWMKW